MLFTENPITPATRGTNPPPQRRAFLFSYEPSHHCDSSRPLTDEFLAGCTKRQRMLLQRPGHWQENWTFENQANRSSALEGDYSQNEPRILVRLRDPFA